MWLYPQTDVFIDLAAARDKAEGDVRFGVTGTAVVGVTSDRPMILFTDAEGVEQEVRCDYLVGADGSHSICRQEIPDRRAAGVFPGVPVRLVRHPVRGAKERARTRSTTTPTEGSR